MKGMTPEFIMLAVGVILAVLFAYFLVAGVGWTTSLFDFLG